MDKKYTKLYLWVNKSLATLYNSRVLRSKGIGLSTYRRRQGVTVSISFMHAMRLYSVVSVSLLIHQYIIESSICLSVGVHYV